MNRSSAFCGPENLRTRLEYEHLTKVQASFDEEMVSCRIGLNTVIYSVGSGKLEGGTSFRSWIQRWKGGRKREIIIIITNIINMTHFMYMERQIRSHSIFF